ncbi:MAG: RNA-guided endonuclease InsQ/TnpB family protein [Culicoidibacterales bacterium]
MILAQKIRLYPTDEQAQKLWQSVGTARFVYNWTLARQEENYQNGGTFISDNELRKELTQLKKTDLAWLSEVSNNVAKQAVKDACLAYKRMFNGLAQKPRFKSRKRSKPSFYNDNVKLKVKIQSVLIEKVGWIKIKEQLPIEGKYTNPRISHDGKYWYLCVGVEQEFEQPLLSNKSLGVDVGIKYLAVCSDGTVFKNINKSQTVRKLEKRLRRLQKQVSRKYEKNKKGSQFVKTENILKLEQQMKLLHRRLKNIRMNHLHQATNQMVKTKPSQVVMETLNIQGMMKNKHLAKAIQKQGLYELKRQLVYKCQKYGISFIAADMWFPSSKQCSHCGVVKTQLSLSERTFDCEACHFTIDRDLNAAINLSNYQFTSSLKR